MSDETHNGWRNYPTWAVNLWLANDEPLYRHALAITAAVVAEVAEGHHNVQKIWTRDEATRFEVADSLKSWVVNDLAPDLGASFASDLLGWALEAVDWHEIADSWIAQVADE